MFSPTILLCCNFSEKFFANSDFIFFWKYKFHESILLPPIYILVFFLNWLQFTGPVFSNSNNIHSEILLTGPFFNYIRIVIIAVLELLHQQNMISAYWLGAIHYRYTGPIRSESPE